MELSDGTDSKWMKWVGYALSVLPCLLLFVSALMKFIRPEGFDEGLEHLGWPGSKMYVIGAVEAACAVIYLAPRSAVLGAILLTAYLGGAVATHVRIGDQFILPILLGVSIWGGLFLRDAELRKMIPFRRA